MVEEGIDWMSAAAMAELPTHHPLDSWPAHPAHPMRLYQGVLIQVSLHTDNRTTEFPEFAAYHPRFQTDWKGEW
jgi:hypothetical protein